MPSDEADQTNAPNRQLLQKMGAHGGPLKLLPSFCISYHPEISAALSLCAFMGSDVQAVMYRSEND